MTAAGSDQRWWAYAQSVLISLFIGANPLSFADTLKLVFLASIWGASFLFMRVAVPEFGVAPLIFLRVGIAALVLLPLLFIRKKTALLKDCLGPSLLNGLLNSAIPFSLIAYSVVTLSSGFASILNATTPIATALVGLFWLGDRLSPLKSLGMLIGVLGVTILAGDKLSISSDNTDDVAKAIGAGILATVFYAMSAVFTKQKLAGRDSLALSTGAQLGATIALLPLAVWFWPEVNPGILAWGSATALALICTAFAYLMFFQLIESIGPTRATTVTFIVPIFGMFWGAVLLEEDISAMMLVACGVTLLGTGLATGILSRQQKH